MSLSLRHQETVTKPGPQLVTNLRIMPKNPAVGYIPIVDGVLVNPETQEIVEVKGFIQVSDQIALDPDKFTPFPIGTVFFHSRREALQAIIKACKSHIVHLQEKVDTLSEELAK